MRRRRLPTRFHVHTQTVMMNPVSVVVSRKYAEETVGGSERDGSTGKEYPVRLRNEGEEEDDDDDAMNASSRDAGEATVGGCASRALLAAAASVRDVAA